MGKSKLDPLREKIHDTIRFFLPKNQNGYDLAKATRVLGEVARGERELTRKERRELMEYARWEAALVYSSRCDKQELREACDYTFSCPDGEALARVIDEWSEHFTNLITETWETIGYEIASDNHSNDLWHHLLYTMAALPPDPQLRIIGFIHDTGKVRGGWEDPSDGSIHYPAHQERGGDNAKSIFSRLGYTDEEAKRAEYIVSIHDRRPLVADDKSIERFRARYGNDFQLRGDLLALMKADGIAHKPPSAWQRNDNGEPVPTSEKTISTMQAAEKIIAMDAEEGGTEQIIMNLTVRDLDKAGLEQYTPYYNRVLNHCMNCLIDGSVENKTKALVECAQKRIERGFAEQA